MMRALQSIDRFWRPVAPPERLAAVRFLVGGFTFVFLLSRIKAFLAPMRFEAHRFEPTGITELLSGPLPPAAVAGLYVLTLLACIPFTLGVFYRLTAPVFALCLTVLTTYRTSWGMIFHTENLMVLHVLVLALSRAADAYSFDARRQKQVPAVVRAGDEREYGWPLRLMAVLLVVTYVIAGVAKLRLAGWSWASGEVLRMHIAYDSLRKSSIGSMHSPFGEWLVPHAWVFGPLAWFSILAELGAPFALVSARLGRAWCVLAWAFHVGVLALMYIVFPYQLLGVAYLPFVRAERVVAYVQRRCKRPWWTRTSGNHASQVHVSGP